MVFAGWCSSMMSQNDIKYPQFDEYSKILHVNYTADTSTYTVLFDSVFYDGGIFVKKHFQRGKIQYSIHPYSTKSTHLFPEKGVELVLKNGTLIKNDTITANYLESKLTPGYAKVADIELSESQYRNLCESEIEFIKVGNEVIYFEKWQRKLMLNIFRNIWNRESARPYFQPRNQ